MTFAKNGVGELGHDFWEMRSLIKQLITIKFSWNVLNANQLTSIKMVMILNIATSLNLIVIGFVPGVGDAIAKVGKKGLSFLDNNRILKEMGEFLGENIIAPILNSVGDLTAPIVDQIKNAIRGKLTEAQDIALLLGKGVDNVIDDVTGRPQVATEGAGNVPSQVDNVNQPMQMFQPDLTRGDTLASEELVDSMRQHGKEITVAKPGFDDERMLNYFGANASVNTENMDNILVRPDVRKIELLEEFLHGTQSKLDIIEKRGHHSAEIHVKDFMIRHKDMLGLSDKDIEALIKLRDSYIKGF